MTDAKMKEEEVTHVFKFIVDQLAEVFPEIIRAEVEFIGKSRIKVKI